MNMNILQCYKYFIHPYVTCILEIYSFTYTPICIKREMGDWLLGKIVCSPGQRLQIKCVLCNQLHACYLLNKARAAKHLHFS